MLHLFIPLLVLGSCSIFSFLFVFNLRLAFKGDTLKEGLFLAAIFGVVAALAAFWLYISGDYLLLIDFFYEVEVLMFAWYFFLSFMVNVIVCICLIFLYFKIRKKFGGEVELSFHDSFDKDAINDAFDKNK